MMRRRAWSVVTIAAIAVLANGGPAAQAAITGTTVTAPSTGSTYFTRLDTPHDLVFAGTATGVAPADTVDVNCLRRKADDSGWNNSIIATNVPTDDATGAWSVTVDLATRPGLGGCLVRALESGAVPPSDLSAFTGPTVYFADINRERITGGPNDGTLVAWFASTAQSGAYNAFGSSYDYGASQSWTFTGAGLRESEAYWSYAVAPSGIGGESFDAPAGVTVDGLYAYMPDSAAGQTFNGTAGADMPGLVGISLSQEHDPATGRLTVVETAPLLRCNADADQVVPSVNCTALVSAGMTLRRTWTQSADGRALLVDEDWSSTDGAAHTLQVQYFEGMQRYGAGASFAFPWVSSGAFAALTAGAAIPLPTAAPYSWTARIRSDATDGDTRYPLVGRVTSAVPTTLKAITGSTSNLLQVQRIAVPAGGATTLRHALVAGAAKADVDALVTNYVDLYVPPTVSITAPTTGSTVDTVPMRVTGTASDNVGVSSLTLNGASVTLSGGSFSAPFTPVVGSNLLTLVARDAAGNATSTSVSFTYVPRNFIGTSGRDRLVGNRLGNVLDALGGDDTILCGVGGRDTAKGGAGNDRVDCVEPYASARAGRDTVNCGPGARDVALVDPFDTVVGCERVTRVWTGGTRADRFRGTRANDRFATRGGSDSVTCGGGVDRVDLGAGNDTVDCADSGTSRAQRASRDVVDCGAGSGDRAIVDRFDVVRRCEHVTRR